MNIIKDILAIVLGIVAIVLAIDFICFWIWILSGQIPVGSFYLGAITAHIIGLFI